MATNTTRQKPIEGMERLQRCWGERLENPPAIYACESFSNVTSRVDFVVDSRGRRIGSILLHLPVIHHK